MKVIWCFLTLLVFNNEGLAQTEIEKSSWWLQYLEMQSETTVETDVNDLTLQLQDLQLHPIRLDSNHLDKLFFISEPEKQAILMHLRMFGPLVSIYELQVIDALSPDLCLIISKCVQLQIPQIFEEPFKVWLQKGQHECLVQTETSLQTPKGYQKGEGVSPYYLGNKTRNVMRYRFQYKQQLYIGLAAEKDKGEPYGYPNFMSVHGYYRGKGIIKSLAIGDYQALFGLGLTFASRTAMGKGAQVLQTDSRLSNLQPYRSVSEFGFLRGAAISIGNKRLQADLLVSRLANNGSGLHRTEKEIANKNQKYDQVCAMHLSALFRSFKVGVIAQLNGPRLRVDPTLRYGFYAQQKVKNMNLSTEISIQQHQVSGLFQLLKPLHSKVDYLLLYRNYHQTEATKFSGAWAEYTGLNNEQGIYQALSIKANRKWMWQLYHDYYWAKLPRYQKKLGAGGMEFFVLGQYKPSKTLQWEFRYLFKAQEKDQSHAWILDTDWLRQQKARAQFTYQLSKQAQLRARYEITFWEQYQGAGFFIEQAWQPATGKWSVFSRYTNFSSIRDETRFYALEKDLPFQYALGSFNGMGSNLYIMVRFEPNSVWDIHLKVSHLVQADGALPGSGWDELSSPAATDISFQIRRRW
jgi:hypothetical protein